MLPTVEDSRGFFGNSLRKVLEQVHPTLSIEESALQYVESLCLRLFAMLCAVPSPLTVQDVEERVARTFPSPLHKWALADAHGTGGTGTGRRRRTILPLDKIHQMLLKEVLLYKIDQSVSLFMTCIVEYVCTDILKLAGNYVKKISHKSRHETLTCSDIKTAMCADKVLMDMFYQESELTQSETAAGEQAALCPSPARRASLSYAELVRDLLEDQRHILRELNLIIRVFKDEIEKILDKDSQLISLIFGNIVDIYELTTTLQGNLEDAMEASQGTPVPSIASCFEELAEVEEFRVYVRYSSVVTTKESREALQTIVDDPLLAERLDTAGHGFRLAVKYYLPKLLLAPLGHVFVYHKYVLALFQIAPSEEDKESFKQVECNLHPIKKSLAKALGNGTKIEATLRMASRSRRQLAIEKCNELSRLVDNWDIRDIGQCCNEFIREDTLSKVGPGKRVAERRAYLFDGLLLLCKPVTSLVTNSGTLTSSSGGAQQLKLKEKLYIRKLEVVDRPDTDEARHVIELSLRGGMPPALLACGSLLEKWNWMCDLVMLNTKPMLDRCLDSILLDLEKRHPLKLPPASLYRFAVPDSPDNIIEEPQDNSNTPLIKGATLLKLVERLTYHIYADLRLVRTFLTTYRSFCSPRELLALLIERFNIPHPNMVYDHQTQDPNENLATSDAEKLSKNTAREDWKRYRKEFEQPVKFRVINVIRHWVEQHFYDFERDPSLLETLRQFLEGVDDKPCKKWVQSVLKCLIRKSGSGTVAEASLLHTFDSAPPAVLRHLVECPERHDWHPLALHPLELARQITLWQFQLYRQVKPSELVGAVWTKKDKEKTSPNLLKMIKLTNNLTRWMEKWIVESQNMEERVAVVCRLVELGAALHGLNNFDAVLAVDAAHASSAVYRLSHTMQQLPLRLSKTLEEFSELNTNHSHKYLEILRSINPPCVPFFGIYLSQILHTEVGNLDYLPNTELINFAKRQMVAKITGEIQQYQNQPYCLTVEPKTRAFLESLDPFPGMNEIEIQDYLYKKSLEIEPQKYTFKQLPKFPRKYPELSLKPVKVSRRQHHLAQHHSVCSNDDTLSVSQLSPTSGSTWDGQSVSSLSLHHDDHKGRTSGGSEDRGGALASPRAERGPVAPLRLLDKGLALITDKLQPRGAARDEPPSPRDRTSPRHDRQSTPSLGERRPQALSPRGAIVDAELFYPERVPPLLPRNSVCSSSSLPTTMGLSSASTASNACNADSGDEAPPLPPRPLDSDHTPLTGTPPCEVEPPDRPLPSPKHHDALRGPMVSPKRSPAPQPPISPLVQGDRNRAFRFPASGSGASASGPSYARAPPLPPRRMRTHPETGPTSAPEEGDGVARAPPLPPRPAAAPALLQPDRSLILQRRWRMAPKLPPKPSAATPTRT